MRKRVIAKCVNYDPRFNIHALHLRSHGLRGDKDGKIYEGYVNDYDVFKYSTKDAEWLPWMFAITS